MLKPRETYRKQYDKKKNKISILFLVDILLTLDAISSLTSNILILGASFIIAILFSGIFLPYIANQVTLIRFINQKRYEQLIIGSNLIIYGIDCGIILLKMITSL